MSDWHGFDYGEDWQGWKRALTSPAMSVKPGCTPPYEWPDENGVKWYPVVGHQAVCPKCGAIWKFSIDPWGWRFMGYVPKGDAAKETP